MAAALEGLLGTELLGGAGQKVAVASLAGSDKIVGT